MPPDPVHARSLLDGLEVQVAVAGGTVGTPFNISIPSPSLWSPQDPHLYRVVATLYMDNTTTSLLAV